MQKTIVSQAIQTSHYLHLKIEQELLAPKLLIIKSLFRDCTSCISLL